MTRAEFPVDLRNPGQVLACLGFMEAAQFLVGAAKLGFQWEGRAEPCCLLDADTEQSPVELVLDFLSQAQVQEVAAWDHHFKEESDKASSTTLCIDPFEPYPTGPVKDSALPTRLSANGKSVTLSHWCDSARIESLKCYAGKQVATKIINDMMTGVPGQTKGIKQLWEEQRSSMLADPLGAVTPLKGTFGFDSRRSWSGLGAGYSPDTQKHLVEASPLVELLAAWGLQFTRPERQEERKFRYGVWQESLLPVLARPVYGTGRLMSARHFVFTLTKAGEKSIFNYAEETNRHV